MTIQSDNPFVNGWYIEKSKVGFIGADHFFNFEMSKNKLNTWEIENKFYLNSHPSRIKIINHYEIFKKTSKIPGVIIECGVFKGNSISRFILFRDLLLKDSKKKVFGFDVFINFPVKKIQEIINLQKTMIKI